MAVKPKTKCCHSSPRCKRCPVRLKKEGRLPKGWKVKKGKVVKRG